VPFGVHQQAFAPAEKQLYRSSGCPGQQGGVNLACDVLFSAEAPACELPANAHLFFRDAQRCRDLAAIGVGDLRTAIDFHAPIGQRHCQAAFRLHEQMVGKRCEKAVFKDNFRVPKALFRVAFAHLDVLQQVPFLMQKLGLGGKRLLGCGKHRQGFQPDLNKRNCGVRGSLSICGNQRQGIPHRANALPNPYQNRPIAGE